MDDEMTFGLMNLLEANAIDEATKADFAALNVYTSAIGGMAELYAVIDGSSTQAATAQTYLAGNWEYKVGDGKYEPVWIVDAGNVANYEGFSGHAS